MAKFDCVKHTVFRGDVYRPGEQLEVSEAEAETVPKHFVRVDAAVQIEPTDEGSRATEPEAQSAAELEEGFDLLWPVARARGTKAAELRADLEAHGYQVVAERMKAERS